MIGKSTVARLLASRFELACLSTDDIGEALRAIATPEDFPDLHPMRALDYREYYATTPISTLTRHAEAQHRACWPAVEAVIRARAAWGQPAVIEGWNLYPIWVRQLQLPNVASLWLLADEAVLSRRAQHHETFFRGASDLPAMMRRFVRRSVWHNARTAEALAQLGWTGIDVTQDATPGDIVAACVTALASMMS